MKKILLCLVLALGLASCAQKSTKLVIYTATPLEIVDLFNAEFTKATGIKVEIVAAGTGELIKRIEAEKANPLADVLWGGTLSAVSSGAANFEAFRSTNEDAVLDAFKNAEGNLSRFSAIPSIIMVNTNLAKGLSIQGYADLLNPALKGKIAFADPTLSSSSFEHLVNMLYAMGQGDPEKGWPFVESLIANLEGKLLSGSAAVYKGVAEGEYTAGLTLEPSSLNYQRNGSPTLTIYMKEGVVSKPDGIYLIKGAKNMENAKAYINFATSKKAQDMLAQFDRRGVRKDTAPVDTIIAYGKINNISDDGKIVSARKTEWLNKFKSLYTKK